MAQQLLSSFGKKGVNSGLLTMRVDIEDTSYLSKYFVISEFNPVFTAGKNPIAFNGSSLLKPGAEIKVQCLDNNGVSQYIEMPVSNVQFSDVAKFVVSINIFNETANGSGRVVFVGTTASGEIVRWIGNITVDKTLQNVSKVRFYNAPQIEARSLLYPVIANDIGSLLTNQITLSGSMTAYAVTPRKDTIKTFISPKNTDVDYRVVLSRHDFAVNPQIYPTLSFNTQMEGQNITLSPILIQAPYSYLGEPYYQSASFTIKKVIDSRTAQMSNAFFAQNGKDKIVANINLGTLNATYQWVAYNTQSDAYQQFVPASGSPILVKQSYAEVVYRNLTCFSGYIARHKLYRKSLLYPGDFQLIADSPLGATEILTDPVTANKSYSDMGTFYNQVHIGRYWYTSSNVIQLSHSVTPRINSMRIAAANSYNQFDGTQYVIVKLDSAGVVNDAIYYPYDSQSFNEMQGVGYNSNFVDLKANTLYVLTMDAIVEKDIYNPNAKITFYFTSSIPSILLEKNYISPYGLKIGEIDVPDQTNIKNFADKKYLYFTPTNDYFGTLVIVPYQCNVSLSELSLKVYGDYGFSPDTLIAKLPFSINIANEGYQLKAELFDINSTLVYSNLNTVQSFDPTGESLFVFVGNSNIDPTKVTFVSGSLTISQSLFLPNLPSCPTINTRLVGYNLPTHVPPSAGDGALCYTNISELDIINLNYINLSTVRFSGSLVTDNARSIAVKYSGSFNLGRKVFVRADGTKFSYP